MSKKVFFIILIFIVLFCIAGFLIYRQSVFSGQILSLNISGPSSANAGDEITYTVTYKNNGNFVLQNPKLIFDMPDNSLTEDGNTRITQSLKEIYPGDEESVAIKTRLLGKEGDLKIAKAALSYTPQNLTVIYESDATFTTKIETVPIALTFDMPSQIKTGQQLEYSINYSSDIDYPLENLSIKVDPNSDFNFVSSSPSSLDNSEWKLQTLSKSQGGKIVIDGNISSDASQKITFSASLGMWQNGIFVVIKQISQDVQIIQPPIFISQQVNDSDSYVASPGDTLHYKIFFRNISSVPFNNLSLTVKLDSPALDISTIQAIGAQIQQYDNMIVWDQDALNQLKYLGPQDQGELDFSVNVKKSWTPEGSIAGGEVIDDQISIAQITQSFSINVNSGGAVTQ